MIKNLLLVISILLIVTTHAQDKTNKTPEFLKADKFNNLNSQHENHASMLADDGCEIFSLKNSKPSLFDINELQFVDEKVGYAVGGSGSILRTVDGGLSWSSLSPISWETNFSVHFKDENNGLVKSYFTIYKTSDGGESWLELDAEVSGAGQLTFINDTTGFYNDGGNIYRTTDRENWELVETFDSWVRYIKIFSETEIIANTSTGIYRSKDNGDTWDTLYENASAELRELQYLSEDVWYMTTSYLSSIGGVAFIRTLDGGVSWDTTKLDVLGTFPARINFLDQENGFVYGGDDTSGQGEYAILKTSDGGESWTETNATTTWNRWDNDMVFINDSVGFVGGRFGAIQMTVDFGLNWQSVTSSDTQFLFDVIYKDSIGLAGGEGGAVFKTTDSGLSWEKKSTPTNLWINNITFKEENIYALSAIFGGGSEIVASSDGGDSWTLLSAFDEYLNAIHFYDDSIGFVAGSLGTYYETVDGGATWTKITFEGEPNIRTVSFPSDSVGYLAGETYLLKTTDAGETWVPVNTTDFGEVYASFFLNEDLGFLGSNYGNIYRTSDGGISFDTLTVISNPDIFSIYFFDENRGYITTSFDVQYTLDGGETWRRVDLPTDSELRDIFFHEDNRATVVGRGGAIFDLLVGEPSVELEITGNTSWCKEDGTQTFTISDYPYLDYYSINWSISGGGTIEKDGNIATVDWTEEGTHSISVFPANSCGQGPKSTFEITVSSIPDSAEIQHEGTSIDDQTYWCIQDGPQTFNISDTDYSEALTYNWFANGGQLEESEKSAIITWDSPGNFQISLIVSNECGESEETAIDVVKFK